METKKETAKFDLALSLTELPDGRLSGSFEYRKELFEAATIRRLSAHFQTLLSGFAACPEQSIATAPLLSARERRT
jgi:non-ribosomal peptide synthetase component F